MKYLFLLLISFPSFACLNRISPTDLDKVLLSNDPSQAETLTYKGADGICFDGINLREADYVDNVVIDITKGASLICDLDCEQKLSELTCELGEEKKTGINEVYCEKQLARIDGKKLVESDVKKAARQAARQAEKDAEDAQEYNKKQALKDLRDLNALPDPSGTTVAQLRAELKDAINQSNKLRRVMKDILKAEINKAE